MSGRVGEVILGPRVVQPQSFLGRRQLASLEETFEHQVALVPQIRQATVGHLHRRPKLDRLVVRRDVVPSVSQTAATARIDPSDWLSTCTKMVVFAGATAPNAAHIAFEDELRLRVDSRPDVRWTS